jgi:hypothetical protein
MGTKSGKRGRDGILSSAIDPLLLEGGRTVREIALFLEAQLTTPTGSKFTLATLINNIRSRMFVLVDRGFKLEKNDQRQVKFVKPVESETASV